MNKALTEPGNELERDVAAYMVLSTAHCQLQQIDRARATFAKGAEIKLPRLESGEAGENWVDWIIADALMREAKSLLDGQSETQAQTSE
jgi:hypothetical protein